MKYADFFTGFGGMTIGAKAAGLDVVFGVEYEQALSDVYRANLGDHVIVEDVTKLDMATLPRVDVFHASPPCTNASVANAKGGESPQDIAMSQAVIDYLTLHKPDIFTLENVMGYRNFVSCAMIARALLDLGYTYVWQHINMADYGVPQTRRRFIVIARRDGKQPQFPPATHAKEERRDLFGYTPRWVSWYEAIEDLIPTLEAKELSSWQIDRLPKTDRVYLINHKDLINDRAGVVYKNKPSMTLTISLMSRPSYTSIYLNNKFYTLTPRTFARFQSFPDWYELPERAGLAVKGLGNAVPPLFAEVLYKHLTTS